MAIIRRVDRVTIPFKKKYNRYCHHRVCPLQNHHLFAVSSEKNSLSKLNWSSILIVIGAAK